MRDQALRAGVIPEWSAYANTPSNTNLQSVRLPGPIVYTYRYFREILLVAVHALEVASPVRSGAYKNAHTVYVDGVEASPSAKIEFGQRIIIANPLPYARRLEIGKTESGRDFLISVPNRIYERVAKILLQRYRNVAKISFGYANIPGAHIIKGRLPSHYSIGKGRRRKRRQVAGDTVKAPAIFIEPLT